MCQSLSGADGILLCLLFKSVPNRADNAPTELLGQVTSRAPALSKN